MIITRYISQYIFISIFAISFIFILLDATLRFVEVVNDHAFQGQLWLAIQYVALGSPYFFYKYFPYMAFMGSVIAYGNLIERNEIIIMSSSGCSKVRLWSTVIAPIVVLLLLSVVLSETMINFCEEKSIEIERDVSLNTQEGALAKSSQAGFWFKNKENYFYIQDIYNESTLGGVHLFIVGDRSIQSLRAEFMIYIEDSWSLLNVTTYLEGDQNHIIAKRQDILDLPSELPRQLVSLYSAPPQYLDIKSLLQLQSFAEISEGSAYLVHYYIVNKIFYIPKVVLLVLIGLISISSFTRGSQVSVRVLGSIGFCLLFKIVDDIFLQLGIVYQLSPYIVICLPIITILILVSGAGYFRRG